MNIAIFSIDHLRDWHGTTRLLDRIAVALLARNHKITIIAHEGTANTKTPVSKMDYPHELIKVDLTTPAARQQANEKIKATNIDIFLASIGNNGIMHIPSMLKGSNIPFVYGDPHDPRVRTFAGWQPYESYGALATADAIQTLLPEYVQLYPAALRPRVTEIGIPAPPPASTDLPARRNKDENKRTIIAVGRLNETMKRFSLLLQAFAELTKNQAHSNWRLKIVGDGPYWEYYHIMAQQLGISQNVDFTGAVLNPGEHYESADIFCSSSLIEGFPLVFSEAAAYALPLVGFDFCVAAKALITPDMGALAKCDEKGATPEALARALRPLMEMTPAEREALGKKACGTVQERYNGEKLYDKWEKLLTDTVNKVRATGETALERVIRMESEGAALKFIGDSWKGLDHDSPVWTAKMLDAAGAEIASRDDPMSTPETSTAAAEAENVRLRCELIRAKEDYEKLEKKYTALLKNLQTTTPPKPHHKKKRK